MKLLVSDFLFVDAHKDMNINFISAISKFAETDVVSLNGFYDDQINYFKKLNVNIINLVSQRKSGSVESRVFSLDLVKKIAKYTISKTYDAVLCLGFETSFLGLGIHYFKGIPLFIFHHKNIDELTNKIKYFAFGNYKNKVYHVVFEDFFRNRLVEGINVNANRVFVVPHPVKPIESKLTEKKYDCIGLCNSNDEMFVQEAVERDIEFSQQKLHILLRSKVIEKKQGAVEVIKGFLEKDAYDELIAAGKTVFVPLPKTYIYRLSGSIYDALSRGIVVFTTSKYYAEEYERRYPGTCKYVGSVDQLIQRLQEQRNSDESLSFQKFIDGHSINTVSQNIEKMIESVLKSYIHE